MGVVCAYVCMCECEYECGWVRRQENVFKVSREFLFWSIVFVVVRYYGATGVFVHV